MKTIDDYHKNVDKEYNRGKIKTYSGKWLFKLNGWGYDCAVYRDGELIKGITRINIDVEAGELTKIILTLVEPDTEIFLEADMKSIRAEP